MRHRVLVVGHADADGHLITEQVRRNLSLIESFEVQVLVDPSRTKDHRFWTQLDSIKPDVARADYVFFVDLMFGPETYIDEARSLIDFVEDQPDKRFFLIDHHPLPLRRLSAADNLRVLYRPDVLDCTFGPRSGMMVVAALCEHQVKEVSDIKNTSHETLALGVRRAAARGGTLPGEKLLALMEADCWNGLLQLGRDDPEYHRLPRGRRPSALPESKTLKELDKIAVGLLQRRRGDDTKHIQGRRTAMAYDADIGEQQLSYDAGSRTLQRNAGASPKDLGVIITLLEVAALSLTSTPGATFTREQLIQEAQKIGGKDLQLDERDVRIVLNKTKFLQKVGREYRLT